MSAERLPAISFGDTVIPFLLAVIAATVTAVVTALLTGNRPPGNLALVFVVTAFYIGAIAGVLVLPLFAFAPRVREPRGWVGALSGAALGFLAYLTVTAALTPALMGAIAGAAGGATYSAMIPYPTGHSPAAAQ